MNQGHSRSFFQTKKKKQHQQRIKLVNDALYSSWATEHFFFPFIFSASYFFTALVDQTYQLSTAHLNFQKNRMKKKIKIKSYHRTSIIITQRREIMIIVAAAIYNH